MRRALILAGTLAASCSVGMDVRVSGTPDAIVFEPLRSGSSEPREVKSVEVADGGGRTLWSIQTTGAICVSLPRVRYGVTPEGFETLTPATRLEPGRTYSVYVRACPANGGSWFRIVGNRIVYRDGLGDAPRAEVEAMQ